MIGVAGGSDRIEINPTDGLLIDGTRAYRRGNVVGAVSQSGGVPTGAVIERGSNSSGEYVRFADGTQICTRDVADGAMSSTSDLNGAFRSDTILYAFPAAFVDSPACSMSMRAPAANGLIPSVGDNSGTHWEARFVAPGAFSQVTHGGFSLLAIGRWF